MRRAPALFAGILWILSTTLAAQTPADLAGHWEGAIALPAGELGVQVDLVHEGGAWSGSIDIPAQGAAGLPLTRIAVDGSKVRFSIEGVPGDPTFDGRLKDGEISGSFRQGGARLTFRLGREALPPPARPQLPKEPFPYTDHEVRYSNGEIELAATLTVPDGEGPFPAVLLLTGSGPQNRDEEIMGHKPFLVLADHLARSGIAVLRADDRGVGGSTGDVVSATTADFAGDALAGVDFLLQRAEIRRDAVGLLGHSEGGLVAPLAASRSDRVRFVVLLAAPGVPGSEILPRQTERIALANGAPPALIERQVLTLREGLGHFHEELSDQELKSKLIEMVRRQLAVGGANRSASDGQLEETLANQVEQMLSPWFRFFVTYDPKPTLGKVEVPVLALNGELDLQVDVHQNLAAIGEALEAAGNEDVTLRRMSGLNHLFQTATTGSPSEYHEIEETFAPAALETISSWILERFGDDPGTDRGTSYR